VADNYQYPDLYYAGFVIRGINRDRQNDMVYILKFIYYDVNGDYTHKGENKTINTQVVLGKFFLDYIHKGEEGICRRVMMQNYRGIDKSRNN